MFADRQTRAIAVLLKWRIFVLNSGPRVLRQGVRLAALFLLCSHLPQVYGLPSFARQTGQKCAACHVGGSWPQLTPWGRFFKLSGYTAGNSMVDKEGAIHVPVGIFGQAGLTWAAQPNDANGNSVIPYNGSPQFYQATAELGTKITNFLGVFYEYELGNEFPGWKGATGAADIRAVHFFHLHGNELLVGIDSTNAPTLQDVSNATGDWSFPFFGSPHAPDGPASPIVSNLASQSGSIGAYALLNRQLYMEVSMFRAATGFFRFMSAGTSFEAGGANYLQGYNPYWRTYWDRQRGPHSLIVGAFGMHARVYPDSTNPSGLVDVFDDYGFDTQYQHLANTHKVTLRGSYTYEKRAWNGSFPLGITGTPKGNMKAVNLSGSYAYDDKWVFNAGYTLATGNRDSSLYAISDPSGNELTSSPRTTGYTLEVDRKITQNVELIGQYRGFLRFNGLRQNIDGLGRSAADNNTLWLSVFFGF